MAAAIELRDLFAECMTTGTSQSARDGFGGEILKGPRHFLDWGPRELLAQSGPHRLHLIVACRMRRIDKVGTDIRPNLD